MARLNADTPTEFRDVPSGAYLWRLRSDFLPDDEWLRAPEKIAADDARLIKPPEGNASTRVMRFSHGTESFILKEYRATRPTARLKAVFRTPAALRAFNVCTRLERLGLPIVHALGAGYRKRSPWHSFLLTRELKSVVSLGAYLRRSRQNRGRAIAALARLMGQLHSAGFVHRDAHLANFVIQTAASEPTIVIVDADGVRRRRKVTLAFAARDMGRLLDYSEPSQREMLRFAVAYSRAREREIVPRALLREMRVHYETRARFTARRP